MKYDKKHKEKSDQENFLIFMAQSGSAQGANKAMEELRDKFDPTYFWCSDCDFRVCKKIECCNIQNEYIEGVGRGGDKTRKI